MALDEKTTYVIKETNYLMNYLSVNMNNICRVCLEKGNKLTPIFDPIKPPHFSVLIMACASVQIHEGDGLPPYICQRCISKLNIAFQFKTQCELSDTKLRQCLENINLYTVKKADGSELIQTQDTSDNVVHDIEDHSMEYDQAQDTELSKQEDANIGVTTVTEPQKEGSIQDTEQQDKETASEYKVEVPPDYDKGENPSRTEQVDMVLNPSNILKAKKRRYPKVPKVYTCDTCGKQFSAKPSWVHHVRIHTGERPYVCHLCQKRFINGGHLHTHMRTHTGEKNHVCVACSKAFSTAQQLTKHTIAIHTSERPYGCTYCSKRFASSSNLSTHIKIHTGEKNFHCEHCGKTFSTKGQLQQHMLTHTGEKAFLCEYCEKRFSQKAHLVRHLKTHVNRTE